MLAEVHTILAVIIGICALFVVLAAQQDWKTVNNFHVRVRRKNPVTGKFVSLVSFLKSLLLYGSVEYVMKPVETVSHSL